MDRGPQYKTVQHFSGFNLPESSLENQENDLEPSLTIQWKEQLISSTKQPNVFGPPLWFVIHNSAAHYPISPTKICQQHAIMFIKTIPYLVSCKECFLHAQEYISGFDTNGLNLVTSTRSSYFKWGVDFHNFVNERLGKTQMSINNAYNMYHNSSTIKVLSYSDSDIQN